MNARDLTEGITKPLMLPIERVRQTARDYNLATLRSDVMAGLTVSVVSIPQAMAYAIVAGVDPRYGLYAVIIQSIVAAIFNSMPLLSVGPTNTQALLVASIVTRFVSPASPVLYLKMVVAMTLIKGLFQLVLAIGRLGNLVRYVSHSVVIGFVAGAGVLIAVGQIHSLLGFTVQRSASDWPGVIGDFQRLLPNLAQTSWISVSLGIGTIAVVLIARKLSRLAPGPLIAIVLTALAVYGFGWTNSNFSLMGAIPRSFSMPALPTLSTDNLYAMLVGGFAMALLGLMEVYSISKSLAAKRGGHVSANQELFGQGAMHFVSSFFWCIPGSGSFSRSALNEYANGKTFLSGIYNALFVLIIFLLFAPAAAYVPMAAIAGILFVVSYGLIDWHYLVRAAGTDPSDAMVCAVTFLATLFAPLSYAVFIGIFLNIAVYLRKAGHLHMAEMVRTPGGPFQERPVNVHGQEPGNNEKRVVFLQVEGNLFFAQADEMNTKLMDLVNSETSVVIFRLRRTLSVDATMLTVLEYFIDAMNSAGKHVILCGIRQEMLDRFESFGLVKKIGRDNVFPERYGIFQSAKQALARAKQLVGSSVDVEGLKDEDDQTEGWSYQI